MPRDARRHRTDGHRTRGTSRRAGAAVLAALLLSGCATTSGPAPGALPTTATSSTGTAASPAPSGGDNDGGTLDYTPGPSQPPPAAAQTLAERFAHLWARHDVPAAAWWHDLEPLCTPQLHEQLRDTDPANIPADAITGHAQAIDSRRGEAVFHLRATGGGTLILGTAEVPQLGWRVATVDFKRAG